MPERRDGWADWLGDRFDTTRLLRREELLALLAEKGVSVSRYDLKNWEAAGTLPLAVRHREGRSPVALYPEEAVLAIAWLRQLQQSRYRMREIGHILREAFTRPEGPGVTLERGRVVSRVAVPVMTATAGLLDLEVPTRPALPAVVQEALSRFAVELAAHLGEPIVTIRVGFAPATGAPVEYDLVPLAIPSST
jgi:hypothetical protein